MRKFDLAEPYFRRALEGRELVYGRDHPDTLIAVNNIACLLENKGELKKAETFFYRAFEGSQRTLGQNHPLTIGAATRLSEFLEAMEKGK